MAVLTTKARKAIPTKSFAEPGKRAYPIEDIAHARNALARVSQFGSDAEKAQVRTAVYKKYPELAPANETHAQEYARKRSAAASRK